MVRPHDLIVSLTDVDRDDTLYVGGKGANLGEMIEAKFPVPPGFVITASAYRNFLKFNRLEQKISHLLSSINYDKQDSLDQVSRHIKKLVISGSVPEDITVSIFDHYKMLGANPLVAIRSSAVGEDSKESSFAGQNETFLNVQGETNIIENVKHAWGSLFESRSIYYRHEKKISHTKTAIALVVQKMVESDSSGVIFTVDPVSGDKTKITIEAIFGLGEYIVQGKVTPDHYEVDKKTFEIISKEVNEQKVMLVKKGQNNVEVKVPIFKRKSQKIRDAQIIVLAHLAARIEKHYYFPQDIEWAGEKSALYIVQTRPITTIGGGKTKDGEQKLEDGRQIKNNSRPILVGSPASPGIAGGPVRKLRSRGELSKIKQGDVLVAVATNPDYVPAMKRASAIITEQGGRTSHAAIVAREFGIPAVVGAPKAMSVLHDNEVVTVNGKTGEVFRGGFLTMSRQKISENNLKTATKIYVNMAEPELAEGIAQRNVDGVGLLRAEFIIAQIGIHPKKLLHERKSKLFVDKLADGIEKICKPFFPRPVLYRATDFKTNEYRNLTGGKMYEPFEANPMIGYRGAFRYVYDPRVFELELDAIRRVREKSGFTNLSLMIPFVRTVRELEEVKKIIAKKGLKRSHSFKIFMMAEIPSNVILIEDFIKTGIDGVSIGSNDLTMLTLGVDRDNELLSSSFDERDKAVIWSFERIISACRKHKIAVSICGQAPSTYPSLVEDLVDMGIDSVSVSQDAIDDTRRFVYRAEERLLHKK